ncbi:sigma-70 family RNA polymerase sigma factor [Roseisolibacter sp. H3M3-2]|uniref:RNA polymerase sigma factor n=1 Tax=Roseisolibacter sp. H3M3-2 TaxID=3031323 RepID=UPI0023DC5038|nr:sigma-70 family RNA polymerase sigma factor [Roseisolibacter sp. H3M3-2]MDF1503528.1 sigma-70 family RNA polymerase sigma factor [Roseisolibacter sp. H3M3-2]
MTETIADPTDDDAIDAALVARWREGDERAATELVRRHAPALARFASSLGERVEVEELVQDTFVRAFQALDGFRADSSLRTWLFTIERRLVLDRRRAAARRRTREADEEADAAVEHTALDAVVADETQARLTAALGRLTPMQREVFTLRVGEGRSYREIAEIAGTTEGAARVHYHNAVRAMKEFVDA